MHPCNVVHTTAVVLISSFLSSDYCRNLLRLLFEGGHNPGKIAACFLQEVQSHSLHLVQASQPIFLINRLKVSRSTLNIVTTTLGECVHTVVHIGLLTGILWHIAY